MSSYTETEISFYEIFALHTSESVILTTCDAASDEFFAFLFQRTDNLYALVKKNELVSSWQQALFQTNADPALRPIHASVGRNELPWQHK